MSIIVSANSARRPLTGNSVPQRGSDRSQKRTNKKLCPGPAGVPLENVSSRSAIGEGGAGATSSVSYQRMIIKRIYQL